MLINGLGHYWGFYGIEEDGSKEGCLRVYVISGMKTRRVGEKGSVYLLPVFSHDTVTGLGWRVYEE